MVSPNASQPNTKWKGQATAPYNQINKVIGVMSAKGGVGKSFVTSLLACQLVKKGFQVGILDADLTTSSISMLFGLRGPAMVGQYSFLPLQSHDGIKMISMNLLFDNENQSVIWKESLTGEAIKELWKDIEWGNLDYLLVDMPPATSEVGLTILQSLPFAGVILVTMPQGLSARIVNKAVHTTQKIGVPILGIVENMTHYFDPVNDRKIFIFGSCHGESVAATAEAPILTQIPVDPEIAKLCDSGKIEDVNLAEGAELCDAFLESLTKLVEKIPPQVSESKVNEVIAAEQEPEADEMQATSSTYSQVNSGRQPYSDIVMYLVRGQENMGVLDHPTAQGYFTGSCGDRMQIDLKVIDGRIIDAKYLAEGCGVTSACGTMITKMACLKTLEEAEKIQPDELVSALGGLPDDHLHCAELAVMTLREAVIDAVEGHGNKAN